MPRTTYLPSACSTAGHGRRPTRSAGAGGGVNGLIDPDVGALHEAGSGKQWLGPPKNTSSARTITLPDFLVPLLRQHHWHRRSNFARRAFRPAKATVFALSLTSVF